MCWLTIGYLGLLFGQFALDQQCGARSTLSWSEMELGATNLSVVILESDGVSTYVDGSFILDIVPLWLLPN